MSRQNMKYTLAIITLALFVVLMVAPSPGVPGPQGPQGEQGERGQVIYGLDGADGLQGTRGHRGLDGTRGSKGEDGVAGATGDPGVLFFSTISKENLDTPKTVTAECPEGRRAIYADSEAALSGGIGDVPWLIYDFENSGPLRNFKGYTVTYVSINDASQIPWQIQVYVACLDPEYITDETFIVEYS